MPSAGELDNELVLEALRATTRPLAAPGERYAYSNVGYILLAEVLATTAGEPLGALAHRRVFAPLDMSATHLGEEPETHQPQPGFPGTVGDGGLWTTANDLLCWLMAMNAEYLGRDATRLIQRPGTLDDGAALTYAWGINVRPHTHGPMYTHGGNWPGWAAKTVRQPSTSIAVALLSTSDDVLLVSDTTVRIAEALSFDQCE